MDKKSHSRSFRTKAQAERHRSRLLLAQQQGERFDSVSGEPESWAPSAGDQSVYDWARQWIANEWTEWAPRTRDSEIEALARFLPLVVDEGSSAPPEGIRRFLTVALRPDADEVETESDGACEAWLRRSVLSLGQLDESILGRVEHSLGLGLAGQPLGANTAGRYRRTAGTCVQRAVDLKLIPENPWPPSPKGRNRRKSRRQSMAIEVERLPDPATMVRLIDAILSHQPSSRMYQTMTCVGYYAGLRPSEVMRLRPSVLSLPDEGWGRIDVVEADDGYDEPADPKTGYRQVPIPPVLVSKLLVWCEIVTPATSSTLLFRTRNDKRPTLSNWNRALGRASAAVGHAPISSYDCRHACATTWLSAGVGLGEAAIRLGHSVETLVAYYVGALEGDDILANERIDEALRTLRSD